MGVINWFDVLVVVHYSENPCCHVLGDDESILLAIPQTSQIQWWHGLKQQGLIIAFVSCHVV